ncbi:MAG: hypothetical protein IH985_06980 [Planctomycetes bacterium]|nr:hypothetical protein [Planctomycetota bacterium]
MEPGDDPHELETYLAMAQPECPECGYELRGLREAVCPECGHRLSVRGLKYHRPSWRTIQFFVGAGGIWLSIVPLGALLWTVFEWGPQHRLDIEGTVKILLVIGWLWLIVLAWVHWVDWSTEMARWPSQRRWWWAGRCFFVPLPGATLALLYQWWR